MDVLLRAIAIYFILLFLFRIAGKRSLAEMTAFDFILLLIIGQATQQALLGDDFSIMTAVLVISTLIATEIVLDFLSRRIRFLDKLTEGVPLVLVENGEPLQKRMCAARVSTADVLQSARASHGIDKLEDIRCAVLEKTGSISIIPKHPQ